MTGTQLIYTTGVVAIGAWMVIGVGGWFVDWTLPRALDEKPGTGGGIEGAGRAIGWAERTLIYAFILANAATAIGLLVAAKSILRIGTVTEDGADGSDVSPGPRARTEYVIFGTLCSFAWAVPVSYLWKWLLEKEQCESLATFHDSAVYWPWGAVLLVVIGGSCWAGGRRLFGDAESVDR